MSSEVPICELCDKNPVPDYVPEYCCTSINLGEEGCGCMGRPIEPCVCDKCWDRIPRGRRTVQPLGGADASSVSTSSGAGLRTRRTHKKGAMDFTELPPGRELDALVAEKVMGQVPCSGWRYASLGSAGGPVAMGTACEHEAGRCYPAYGSTGVDAVEGPLRYSTDIAAAWAIVDHLLTTKVADKFDVSYDGAFWDAHFLQTRQTDTPGALCEYRNVYAEAKTAAYAICRAALKAIKE